MTPEQRAQWWAGLHALDVLHHAVGHIRQAWNVNCDRGTCQSNLEARAILIGCQFRIERELTVYLAWDSPEARA